MNIWKVILATLVIFGTGVITGALVVKNTQPPVPAPVRRVEMPLLPQPLILQERFLDRMNKELRLLPEQRLALANILGESRERNRILMSLLGPELKQEMAEVREKIRGTLRPEQYRRFEELLQERPRNLDERPNGAERRPRDFIPPRGGEPRPPGDLPPRPL